MHCTVCSQETAKSGKDVERTPAFGNGRKRSVGTKRARADRSITEPSFQWAAVWLGCMALSVAGGIGSEWIRDLHAAG